MWNCPRRLFSRPFRLTTNREKDTDPHRIMRAVVIPWELSGVAEYIMKQRNVIWEYTEALLVAIVLAVVIRFFIVQAYKIPSGSMLETLQIGDYLLVTRFNYGIKIPFTDREILHTGDPQRGDIIVFKYPRDTSQDYIKRIEGLPGDTIEMRNKQLYRNGQKVVEPYIQNIRPNQRIPGVDDMAPIRVPEGKYFVMGDNRDGSADSREWGFVPREYIQGKAWIIYWSWASFTDIRWGRIGTLIR